MPRRRPGPQEGTLPSAIRPWRRTHTALDVDRLGSKPIAVATFKAGQELAGDTVTATPSGRLLVAWFLGRGTAPALFVRLSNATGTKYGKAEKIALPPGTTTIWKVYLNAQTTKLNVLALVTQHGNSKTTAYWDTQIPRP